MVSIEDQARQESKEFLSGVFDMCISLKKYECDFLEDKQAEFEVLCRRYIGNKLALRGILLSVHSSRQSARSKKVFETNELTKINIELYMDIVDIFWKESQYCIEATKLELINTTL